MSYIVFARKWRPQAFDDIIGQEYITTTLRNAIKQDRVAHAYLFCGPRGIGKTTTARLLAKALNCEKGPTPTPCNTCVSCKEITEAGSVDIIEIDGASNRGVDEIRNIRENVRFSPQQGRFKIYIIDEVHMLTSEAFNALLKTLEEPPAHVKFIFATTAPYKVPATILSRCQRFNFRRLSTKDIAQKLNKIAKQENVDIEEPAVFAIVKAASGSMRDAESLLDQLATYCKNNITIKDVNRVLGSVEEQTISDFAQHILDKDTSAAIKLINSMIDEGVDANQFILSLIEYFRSAMLIKEGKQLNHLLDISKDEIENIGKQTRSLTREDMLYILYNLINTSSNMRRAASAKILLELLAVKLSQKESIVSLDEIMKRLASLEQNAGARENITSPATPVKHSIKEQHAGRVEPPVPTARAEDKTDDIQTASIGDTPALDADTALYRIREVMPQAIKNIKQEKIYIASCLSEGRLVSFKDNILTIGFSKENNFHKESLEKVKNTKLIEEHISKLLNTGISLQFIIIKDDTSQPINSQKEEQPKSQQPEKNPLKKVLSDPIIKTALDIFDGNVMRFM